MDDGTREIRPGRAPGTVPYEEEFLFHLSRGGELLVENHVERAKEELERALQYQPHDAKGQDLLASVYFRLGLHPRAIEIWSRLTRNHPNDLALRVNLGLVLLKTGQPEEARANFLKATQIDPTHARAYRYLGLAQWRCGQLDEARESFLKGGEVTMARRMEEMLGETGEPPSAPASTASLGDAPRTIDADRAQVRSAASDALERFATETAPLALEPSGESSSAGPWRVVEQGRETVPRTNHVASPEGRRALEPLASCLQGWSLARGPALAVAPNGMLALDGLGPVVFRPEDVVAVSGAMRVEPVAWRGRSEASGRAFVLAASGLTAFVAPPHDRRFFALALVDDALFVTETHLEAFDATLTHEWARVGDRLDVVSLRGTGAVVLRLPAAPSALQVTSGEVAQVAPEVLVGWAGRLFPADLADGSVSGMLAFRGDGTLLVTHARAAPDTPSR